MSDFCKAILVGLMILYVISPVDACPGPLDDVLLLLIGMAARKKLA